jgi:hypothetical protein
MSAREKSPKEPTPREAMDDDRAAILARRSAFVAAALATITAAAACEPSKDSNVPSLEAPPARPLPEERRPEPCLTARRPENEPDAAPVPDAPSLDAGRGPEPVPCLSVAPTAVPAPCLSQKAPPHPCLSVRKPQRP